MNIISKFTSFYNINPYMGAIQFSVENVCCKKMKIFLKEGYYQLSKKGFRVSMGNLWKQSILKYCPFCGEKIMVK